MGFFDMFKRKASKVTAAAPSAAAQSAAAKAAQASSAAAGSAASAAAKAAQASSAAATSAAYGSAASGVGLADADVQAVVAEEISQESGGLGGLMDKFGAGGLGDIAQSWIGKGENKRVSADQIKSVFGVEKLQSMASKLGVSADTAADKLAAVLPTVIDKLTPDGMVPDPDALSQKLTGFIKKTF